MTIVHISDNAKLDLQQIYDFIAEYSVQYADNQLNRIIKTIEILKVSGFELSGMVDEYNSNYRRLIQGNYKILVLYKSVWVAQKGFINEKSSLAVKM